MLEYINEAGFRIAAIIDKLLRFAANTGVQVELHALETLIDRALELTADDRDLKAESGFDKIRILKEYDDSLPLVPCEAEKIQQVVRNILSNAAQALRRADIEIPTLTIRTRLDGARQMAEIELEDNGPGMEKATTRRVFEPFFTTNTLGEGMGLGLSLAYFIVSEQHGGGTGGGVAAGKGDEVCRSASTANSPHFTAGKSEGVNAIRPCIALVTPVASWTGFSSAQTHPWLTLSLFSSDRHRLVRL